MTTYIRLARHSTAESTVDRVQQRDGYDIRKRMNGISYADFSDGPPIGEHTVTRIEAELSRCLIAGAWSVAKRVIERTRDGEPLTADKATLERHSDGRKLAYGDAGIVARRCGVMLMPSKRSVRLALSVLERSRLAYLDAAEIVTAKSHIGVLDVPYRTGNAIEELGVVCVGELAVTVDEWHANPISRPRGIGNKQAAEIEHELERHGLLGPVALATREAARAKRLCLPKVRAMG
jgi:hypothetical protein